MNLKIISVLVISIALFTHYYTPKLIIEPDNSITNLIKHLKHSKETQNPLKNANISFSSFDGYTIKGVFQYASTDSTKGTIILLHGIRGDRNYFNHIALKLNSKGYNTLLFDLRGHGESGGQYCTFGAKEKYDVKHAINALKEHYSITEHIGVWGQSLGGSIALQAMSIDNRIEFGIIESTFSDYQDITHEYFNRIIGFKFPIFVSYLTKRAACIADFQLSEAKTFEACKRIKQPVFIAHGDMDIHIPLHHGLKNYEALKSDHKTFRLIKNATHTSVWEQGGDVYINEVLSFIDLALNKKKDRPKGQSLSF